MKGCTVSTPCADHRVEVHRLALQHDLALADARDVEQLLDQAGHLPQLPIGDVERPCEPWDAARRRGGSPRWRYESAPADCAARATSSRGTRPCAGWPAAVPPAPPGARGSRAAGCGRGARSRTPSRPGPPALRAARLSAPAALRPRARTRPAPRPARVPRRPAAGRGRSQLRELGIRRSRCRRTRPRAAAAASCVIVVRRLPSAAARSAARTAASSAVSGPADH